VVISLSQEAGMEIICWFIKCVEKINRDYKKDWSVKTQSFCFFVRSYLGST
jgi:hypothetical protein